MDLYFWLIDRAGLQDDNKNQVHVEQNKVSLHRDHAQKLFNGMYISTLLLNMRKIVIKKSKKSFTLDPSLYELKDQTVMASRVHNWSILQPELKKFGVKLEPDTLKEVLENQEITMEGIVQQLFKYDQTANAYPDVVGLTGSIIKSGLYPNKNSVDINVQDLRGQVAYHKQTYSGQSHIQNSGRMRFGLESEIGIYPGAVRRAKNKDADQLDMQMDEALGSIPTSGTIGSVDRLASISTLPDFIIETLSISLKMHQSQAAALLTSNQKFLIHLCVKGMKGRDYSKLKSWYKLLFKKIPEFIELCEKSINDVITLKMAFNVIKCGLFSHNFQVSELCCALITKIWTDIGNKRTNESDGVLKIMYEWFVKNQVENNLDTSFKNASSDIYETWLKIPKKPDELESLITQAGMKTVIRCWFYHQDHILEKVAGLFLCFGQIDPLELITVDLRRHMQNNKDFIVFIHDHFNIFNSSQVGKNILIESGCLNKIVTFAIELATNEGGSLVERQTALAFLVNTWKVRPDYIEKNKEISNTIVEALKTGCRDMKSTTLRTNSYYLTFSLLFEFGKDRNKSAPTIYHSLTYMLIECYNHLEQREDLLKNFILVFNLHPNIPINILCEPLLKQIQIYLEKDNNKLVEENQTSSILMPDSELFNLNTTDFELFMCIATHKKTTIGLAVTLMEIACEISRKHIMFTRASLKLVLTLLARFESYNEMYYCVQEVVRQNLKVIVSQDMDKVSLYVKLKEQTPMLSAKINDPEMEETLSIAARKAKITKTQLEGIQIPPQTKSIVQAEPLLNLGVDGRIDDNIISPIFNSKHFPEETNAYMNFKSYERMIINLLQCIIHSGHTRFQDYIKEQLLTTFLKIEMKTKFRNKGLFYLMGLFGKDVESMLKLKRNKVARDRLGQMKATRQTSQMSQLQIDITSDEEDYKPPKPSKGVKHAHFEVDAPAPKFSPMKSADYHSRTDDKKHHKIRMDSQFYDFTGMPLQIGDIVQTEIDLQMPPPRDRPKSPKIARIEQTQLFDIEIQPTYIQENYVHFVKGKMKLFKALFHYYASKSTIKHKPKMDTFETFGEQSTNMNNQEVFRFMNDYKISKNEFQHKNDIISIIKMINIKQNGPGQKGMQSLDLEGFIEFILQMGHKLYKIISVDPQVFLSILFDRLRIASLQSQTPMFQKMFEGIQPVQEIDPAKLRELALHINLNPHYVLPTILKKEAIHISESPGMQGAQEVIQDILSENFGFEIYKARLAQTHYRVKYDPIPDKRHQPKNLHAERTSYITLPGNVAYRPQEFAPGTEQSPAAQKVPQKSIAGFNDYQSQGSVHKKHVLPEIVEIVETEGSRRRQVQERYVPKDYEFVYEKQTVGGLARNSHGAKLLEDLSERNATRVSQTLLSPNRKGTNPGGLQLNKIKFIREQVSEIQRKEKQKKEQIYQERATELRQQVEEVKSHKMQTQRDIQAKKRSLSVKKQVREEERNKEKEEHYATIKQEYEQDRLPEIKQKRTEEFQKRKQDKHRRFENARDGVGKSVGNLKSLFEQMAKEKAEKEAKERQKEIKYQKQLEKERKKLKNQSAIKSEIVANKDFIRNRKTSPASAQVLKSSKTVKLDKTRASMASARSLNKSPVKRSQTNIRMSSQLNPTPRYRDDDRSLDIAPPLPPAKTPSSWLRNISQGDVDTTTMTAVDMKKVEIFAAMKKKKKPFFGIM